MEAQQKEIDELKEKVDESDKKLDRILNILESDDKIKSPGLVERMKLAENKIEEIIIQRVISKTKAGVYGSVGAGVLIILWELVKYAFSKITLFG